MKRTVFREVVFKRREVFGEGVRGNVKRTVFREVVFKRREVFDEG